MKTRFFFRFPWDTWWNWVPKPEVNCRGILRYKSKNGNTLCLRDAFHIKDYSNDEMQGRIAILRYVRLNKYEYQRY